MPRDLFNGGTTPTPLTRAFSRYTVLCSAALHLVIIAVVLIVPLLADDVLPKPNAPRVQFVNASFVTPTPSAPATPEPPRAFNRNAAPTVAPPTIRDPDPSPPANVTPYSLTLENTSPTPDGLGSSVGESLRNATPTPPPAPVPVRAPTKPVPIGGLIREPIKTHYVAPVYPLIAQSARIEGDVVIQAVIGTDGVVQEARVLSGRPLLNDAALDAVRQWRYTPSTLNNQPVAVIMTVTVTFRLQH